MSNLIIDIGNTAVKASRSDGKTIGKTYRYQGEKTRSFINGLAEEERPEVMVISSVYDISSADESIFRKECGKLAILDGRHRDVSKEEKLPDYITYDRAASVIAARHLFRGKGCTIIDFGTTMTVDFIDGDGNYLGGNVSLGCRTRFKALNRYSRALPLVNMPSDVPLPGESFETSISSGVISGMEFEISGYADLFPENNIIFTGGDAIYFAKRAKKSIFVVCNLVLIGLAIIADRYVEKI